MAQYRFGAGYISSLVILFFRDAFKSKKPVILVFRWAWLKHGVTLCFAPLTFLVDCRDGTGRDILSSLPYLLALWSVAEKSGQRRQQERGCTSSPPHPVLLGCVLSRGYIGFISLRSLFLPAFYHFKSSFCLKKLALSLFQRAFGH